MLKINYVRDGKNQILGDGTTGFRRGEMVARNHNGQLLGRSSRTFQTTRDADGKLVSRNTPDTGLLFRKWARVRSHRSRS